MTYVSNRKEIHLIKPVLIYDNAKYLVRQTNIFDFLYFSFVIDLCMMMTFYKFI